MLLSAERSLLLVIDIQDRLLPAIDHGKRVVAATRLLLQAARTLSVPVLASEQYPRGLGRTVAEVAELLPDGVVVEKTHFSCMAEPGFPERLAAAGRDQVVVVGIEAHICVLQTVLGLRRLGRDCFVVADGVSSRTSRNAELALDRARSAGAGIVSAEMVLFEWLHQAGTPAFKELSKLVK